VAGAADQEDDAALVSAPSAARGDAAAGGDVEPSGGAPRSAPRIGAAVDALLQLLAQASLEDLAAARHDLVELRAALDRAVAALPAAGVAPLRSVPSAVSI
jgi:hypothetical protein